MQSSYHFGFFFYLDFRRQFQLIYPWDKIFHVKHLFKDDEVKIVWILNALLDLQVVL